MASSDDFGKNMHQLHQDFVTTYKTRFACENMHVATVQCSPMWQKMRKEYKTFPSKQSQVLSQIKAWKKENTVSNRKGTIQSLWKNSSKKGNENRYSYWKNYYVLFIVPKAFATL